MTAPTFGNGFEDIFKRLQSCGLSPLPVAPKQDPRQFYKIVKARGKHGAHCPLDENLQPIPLYTGKNPSYLGRKNDPHLINHGLYQQTAPTPQEIKLWFQNPSVGVGTLLGNFGTIAIDIDAKHFESGEVCDRRVREWLEAHPVLQDTWTERTHSGGWRFLVKAKQKPDFTNFTLEPGGRHVGEALGAGRFTVLAPTVGPSGNPYRIINRTMPVEIESLEAIGIYPTSKSKNNQVESQPKPRLEKPLPSTPGTIPLEELGTDETRDILRGANPTGDRSEALTKAICEWCGWENWARNNGVLISGKAEDLAHAAGEALGIDSDRVDRILRTIDLASCHPAASYKGDETTCWLKVRKLDKATYEGAGTSASENESRFIAYRTALEQLSTITDIVEQSFEISQVATRFHTGASRVEADLRSIKQRSIPLEKSVFDLGEFLDSAEEALTWVVPGLVSSPWQMHN